MQSKAGPGSGADSGSSSGSGAQARRAVLRQCAALIRPLRRGRMQWRLVRCSPRDWLLRPRGSDGGAERRQTDSGLS